jgi:lysine 6-dehydrogenase
MRIVVLGSGMMGQAIAYDLSKFSNFDRITLTDKDNQTLQSAKKNLSDKKIDFKILDIEKISEVNNCFKFYDIAISAVPYKYNYILTKTAIENKIHLLDLGGNNTIVDKQRSLSKIANKRQVIIIPDCGLAPGMTSVLTRDITETLESIDYVKIRVGGLPLNPKPPLNYQIVFSPNGLINEYIEDAIVLDNRKIVFKKSMTEIEKMQFPKPFGKMEAFLTSGGCSTLPYTFKNKIGFLDYKTIRYPGHCEKFKLLLDIGLGDEKQIKVGNKSIIPREILINFLYKFLPINEKDAVLLKVISKGKMNGKKVDLTYSMIDYYDDKNKITSMMRTTAYPTSIIAQMIEQNLIKQRGIKGCEEVVPCKSFLKEIKKRNINIKKRIK